MRGDFEVDKGGYPIAAMPNHLVKGESYIMDVRTMNKLLDARNIPTKLASHIAAVLNAGLRAKRYESDWVKLNASSLEVYEAVIDPTEIPQVEHVVIEAPDSAEDVEGVQDSGASSAERAQDAALATLPEATSETSAALAAIIAEANGHTDDGGSESAGPVDSASDTNDADKPAESSTDTKADDGAGAAVAERVSGTILTPAPLVIPAIQPLQAPAK